MESQRSIWQRRGENHGAFPDQDRLRRIAANEWVDLAILLDPPESELGDLDGFYYRVWQELSPDFVFFGDRDYHWRPVFEERARKLGGILLWNWSEVPFSTTDLLSHITSAS